MPAQIPLINIIIKQLFQLRFKILLCFGNLNAIIIKQEHTFKKHIIKETSRTLYNFIPDKTNKSNNLEFEKKLKLLFLLLINITNTYLFFIHNNNNIIYKM